MNAFSTLIAIITGWVILIGVPKVIIETWAYDEPDTGFKVFVTLLLINLWVEVATEKLKARRLRHESQR